MESSLVIKNALSCYRENELIFASQLYKTKLYNYISEAAFYKTLERMTKSGALIKIAKGTYHLPKISKYGTIPPSEKEIIDSFIDNSKGIIIGYSLFNDLNLTTQVAKNIEILSSNIDSYTKTIKNVIIRQVQIDYTENVKNIITSMEVLQNYYNIQDINNYSFLELTKKISSWYNEAAFKKVNNIVNYKKSTIAFLREILNYYGVKNNLNIYLSSLSEYKYPKMEELYESTRAQGRI